ncbi:hypothetical protein HWV62_28970 [Athelia sp. TMB]|nr:hypothetical protein HWV62_28970 [Athelia sp. TMB]
MSMNPDSRPLPDGWTEHFDEKQKRWFYVENVIPPRSSTVHPASLNLSPPLLAPDNPFPPTSIVASIDRMQLAVPPYSMTPRGGSPAQTGPPSRTGSSSPTGGSRPQSQSFAQKLYASSMAKTSHAPSPAATPATPVSSYGPTSHIQRGQSINLSVPAPRPVIENTPAGAYPDRLRSYLASQGSSRGQNAPQLPPSLSAVHEGPAPSQAAPPANQSSPYMQGPPPPIDRTISAPAAPTPAAAPPPAKATRASMLYASAMSSRNAEAGPSRVSQVASAGPSRSESAPFISPVSEMRNTVYALPSHQRADTEPSIPSYNLPSVGPSASHQSQPSYHGSPVAQQDAATYQGRPPRQQPPSQASYRTSMLVSHVDSSPTDIRSPGPPQTLPAHAEEPKYDMSLLQGPTQPQAPMPPQAPLTQAQEPSYDMSLLQGASHSPQSPSTYDASMLQSQAGSSRLPSPPAAGTYVPAMSNSPVQTSPSPSSQMGYPFPPTSPNAGNGTPRLSPSSPTSPPTPSYAPMLPTPQDAPPLPPPKDASQPNIVNKKKWLTKNTMIGLGAGAAAGIVGGVVLNDVINGNGGGMDSGGLLGGMFDNNGGNGSGGGIFPGFGSDGGDGSSFLDSNNQPDQTQYTYQSSGGGGGHHLAHLAGQAWKQYKKYQQNHPQQAAPPQQQAPQSNTSYPTQYPSQSGAPPPMQHAPPGNADPGYQAAHNAYYAGTQQPQRQASYQDQQPQTSYQAQQPQPGPSGYGQASGQPQGYGANQSYQPPPQKQGLNINKKQVKQFAKGAMLAGGVLAKLNGMNIGGGNVNVNPLGGN